MTDRDMTPNQLYFPFMAGFYDKASEWGYPLMRFFTGLILVPHGAQKLFGWFGGGGIGGTAGFFSKIGLEPAFPLAILVASVEFFGGLLLAVGFLTRFVAAAIAIELFVAAFYVHLANGFFWTKGGLEYPLLWALLAVGIFLRGADKFSVDQKLGREL